jgi:hypothetical protein
MYIFGCGKIDKKKRALKLKKHRNVSVNHCLNAEGFWQLMTVWTPDFQSGRRANHSYLAPSVKIPNSDVSAQTSGGQQLGLCGVECHAPGRARMATQHADALASLDLQGKLQSYKANTNSHKTKGLTNLDCNAYRTALFICMKAVGNKIITLET